MHKLIYPTRDATLYSRHPERNTGVDQVIELTKIASGSAVDDLVGQYEYWENTYNSRILMDFDLSVVSASISSGGVRNPQFYLTFKSTEAVHLPLNYTLYAYPISGSWTNGTGYYNNDFEVTNGVSWLYRNGSLDATAWTTPGGDYYTQYAASQSFNYASPDLRMDITPIVRLWFSGSIPQNGLMLKHTSSAENDDSVLGSIKFFSRDTHTIYIPRIECYWDSHSNSGTSSITEVSIEDSIVHVKNLRESYKEGEIAKIRLGVRQRYPTFTYSTSSFYSTSRRLPATTYYQIQDVATEEVIVPFHEDGTKISCDTTGNYFVLDMDTFMPERFYKIVLKVMNSDQSEVRYIDQNYMFKVIR